MRTKPERCAVCGISRPQHGRHGCRRFMYSCPDCGEYLVADVKQWHRRRVWKLAITKGIRPSLLCLRPWDDEERDDCLPLKHNSGCWRCRLYAGHVERREFLWRWARQQTEEQSLAQMLAAFRERREQESWLQTGRRLLAETRRLVRQPSRLQSLNSAYARVRTLPN